MRRAITTLLSVSLLFGSIPKASANPALIPAAPAICATGVGCVLLGTVVVGGTVAYLWQNGGQRIAANAKGRILQILVDPEDPEGSMNVPDNGGFFARNQAEARRRCKSRGYRDAVSKNYPSGGKYYVCVR